MEELISKVSEFGDLHGTMRRWCQQNSIEQPKILSYSLERISKLYENFLDKYGSQSTFIGNDLNTAQPIWFENELILFQWTVIAFSLTHQIYLNDFKNSQMELLSSIFRHKKDYIIEYEIKCMLVKGKQIRNAWKAEEQELLSTIIQNTTDKNKWNQIARQLYKISEGKYFRQGKHCRERWFSYMENRTPGKQWDLETDIELLELISAIGKRWSQIANKFTKPQSRLTLKKRFKILLEEAYAKFGHNISQKKAFSFLLKQKYEKASYSQKINVSKKEKKKLQGKEHSIPPKSFAKKSQDREFSSKSDEQWLDGKEDQIKCKNCDQQKINVVMQPQMTVNMDQNRKDYSSIMFANAIQITENITNVEFVPIQYYPQLYPIMGPATLQSLSYCMSGNGYPVCGPLMFYL